MEGRSGEGKLGAGEGVDEEEGGGVVEVVGEEEVGVGVAEEAVGGGGGGDGADCAGGEGEEGDRGAGGGVCGAGEEPWEERGRGRGGGAPGAADGAEAEEVDRVLKAAGDEAEEVAGEGRPVHVRTRWWSPAAGVSPSWFDLGKGRKGTNTFWQNFSAATN